ncbi:MAG TPA: hypothetical protein PKO35_00220, partial [Candidatus Atribacteria bacterium]|nr:hypothetical protein [Candidatus Atribacteria bacterium]
MSPSHKNKKVILILLTASLVILAAAAIKIIALDQVKSVVTVEAGDRFPDISSFLRHENAKGSFMTDITKIDMNVTGVYDIEIRSGNRTYISKLEVVDTTAPKASVRELETWVGERKSAIDFVDKVIDISTVDVYYRQEPDFEQVGVQNVYIVLEDQSGNKSEFKTRLTVKADEEPPVIEGVTDHTVYIGETIAYRKGITVTDNRDENVDFTVDSSSVNLRKEGQYVVI